MSDLDRVADKRAHAPTTDDRATACLCVPTVGAVRGFGARGRVKVVNPSPRTIPALA
jgi:hypothetical protein